MEALSYRTLEAAMPGGGVQLPMCCVACVDGVGPAPDFAYGGMTCKICASDEIERAVASMNHLQTACETTAERAFLASIHASCVTPVGVKATHIDDRLAMRAILFSADGARDLAEEISDHLVAGDADGARRIGEKLGAKMIARGALELLNDAGAG